MEEFTVTSRFLQVIIIGATLYSTRAEAQLIVPYVRLKVLRSNLLPLPNPTIN